jgi:hypothetical protein
MPTEGGAQIKNAKPKIAKGVTSLYALCLISR